MSSVISPPRPPAAKPSGNGNTAHAASRPNGNGNGAGATVGYSKQDAEQLRAMILAAVAKGEMTVEQASKELSAIVEVRTTGGRLYLKVSRKGAVSLYGMNVQFPVTLYADQWERLFDFIPEIKKFIAEWDGRDYHGESQGTEYTAQLSRKQRG